MEVEHGSAAQRQGFMPARVRGVVLTENDRRTLALWNDTAHPVPGPPCLHERFEAQVERTPEAVALSFAGETLRYAELNRRANQLAHRLRSLGVGPEGLVAVAMERSLELVVSLLAVMKAGGAYLPLDPRDPQGRLATLLRGSGARVLLAGDLDLPAPREGDPVVVRVGPSADPGGEPTDNPASGVGPDNLAYVIYTSGSTGVPKGAMNTHRGIVNRLFWMQEAYGLGAADRVLQKTPFTFDVSVWELFWPLITGARLVIARPGGHRESDYLASLIAAEGITTVHFVPSMLKVFLDHPAAASCRSLVRVICSGEALSCELQQRFFSRLPAELHNLYGPTEAAVDVTAWACERQGARRFVPIGRPIFNTTIHILDETLAPVPIGVPGELCIGGVQVARGYLGQPELTAERFVPDPFRDVPGARLYRTGDLARHGPDGVIEFLGRLDDQVKIAGVRIEPGEIEAILLAEQESVREAVVTLAPGDDKRLLAYVVPVRGAQLSPASLRALLKEKLPSYMVPAGLVVLEEMPLTSSGKVDRRALAALAPRRGESSGQPEGGEAAAPGTPAEEALLAIWREVLGVDGVGMQDNFFELGGHSLLMTQVASRVREAFGVELSLWTFFQSPTVASLARAVSQAQDRQGDRQEDSQDLGRILDQIESLSEQELNAMLGRG
jgi:amino acid adenylation domain-containing protein